MGGRRLLDWLSDGRTRQRPGYCDELSDLVWRAACVDDGVRTQDTSVSVEQEEGRAGQDGGVICGGAYTVNAMRERERAPFLTSHKYLTKHSSYFTEVGPHN